MKRFKAAAVQIAPDLSGSGTVDRVCTAVEKAAAQGVELAVFPETLIPYYPYFSFVVPPVLTGKEHLRLYEQSIEIPGPVTARLAQSAEAARMVLVVGVNERDGGTLYNTQLVFDSDGSLVLRRRKITPSYHERMIWGQGDGSGFRTVNTAVGRVGALACWEHYNPLARFALMEAAKRYIAPNFQDRWSAKFSRIRSPRQFAITPWNLAALSLIQPVGLRMNKSLRLPQIRSCRERSEAVVIR